MPIDDKEQTLIYMQLVTVKTFDDAISAHIIKTTLEDSGIECFVHDDNIVTLNPLYNFAVGGVKLKVLESDSEEAIRIICDIESKPHTDKFGDIISCPSCESTEVYSNFKSMKDPKGVIAAIISLVFVVFPIYYKSVYRCKKCGTEFTYKRELNN